MGRGAVELAEMNLAVAHRLFDNTIEGAGRILRARAALESAKRERAMDQASALVVANEALADYCESMISNAKGFFEVRQAASKFVTSENWADGDGWKFPVQIMRTGWADGSLEDALGQFRATPHFFPQEIVAQVAQASNGARFRRRHPEAGDGADAPELTAGFLSDCRMQGTAAIGTVTLLKSEGGAGGIRSTLLAAREAGKLDLFGVSIMATFEFARREIDGQTRVVATSLKRLIGVDFCAEPGAGGKFLSAATG